MCIPFQISPEGMQCGKNTGDEFFVFRRFEQALCRQCTECAEQMPVVSENIPQNARHSECDVLPRRLRQNFLLGGDPLIGSLLPTGAAKARFTAEANPFDVSASRIATNKIRKAHRRCAASEKLNHRLDNNRTNLCFVALIVMPPLIFSLQQ